jgi:hypothetical protein
MPIPSVHTKDQEKAVAVVEPVPATAPVEEQSSIQNFIEAQTLLENAVKSGLQGIYTPEVVRPTLDMILNIVTDADFETKYFSSLCPSVKAIRSLGTVAKSRGQPKIVQDCDYILGFMKKVEVKQNGLPGPFPSKENREIKLMGLIEFVKEFDGPEPVSIAEAIEAAAFKYRVGYDSFFQRFPQELRDMQPSQAVIFLSDIEDWDEIIPLVVASNGESFKLKQKAAQLRAVRDPRAREPLGPGRLHKPGKNNTRDDMRSDRSTTGTEGSAPYRPIFISSAADLPQVFMSFPRGADAGFALEQAVQKNGNPVQDCRALEAVLRSNLAESFVAALSDKVITTEEVLGKDCAAVRALRAKSATAVTFSCRLAPGPWTRPMTAQSLGTTPTACRFW